MRSRLIALLLAVAALALVGGACGGDDDGDEITIPSISIPEQTTTAPETTPETTPQEPDGGTQAPDPAQPDSPQNDVPPPPGSPQERFENFCKQNPGACG